MTAPSLRRLSHLLRVGAILVLAGCDGGPEVESEVRPEVRGVDCPAVAREGAMFHSVTAEELPAGATFTTETRGPRGATPGNRTTGAIRTGLSLRFAGLTFEGAPDGPDRAGVVLHLRVPEGCALTGIAATVAGTSTLPDRAEAVVHVGLDQRNLHYNRGAGRSGPWSGKLVAEYQPGYVDPPPAPAGTARDGETAFRIPLTFRAAFYGDGKAEASVTVDRVELSGTLAAAE